MSQFNRYNAQRGGLIRLKTSFFKDDVLADPYSPGILSIFNPTGSGILIDIPYPSGIVREATGVYYYDFQSTSGMPVGLYTDLWEDIQFTAGGDMVSGINSFQVLYNAEDTADWDIRPS